MTETWQGNLMAPEASQFWMGLCSERLSSIIKDNFQSISFLTGNPRKTQLKTYTRRMFKTLSLYFSVFLYTEASEFFTGKNCRGPIAPSF